MLSACWRVESRLRPSVASLSITLFTWMSDFGNSEIVMAIRAPVVVGHQRSLLRPALISGSGRTASCTLLAFGASLAPTLGEELNSDEHDTHEPATHDTTRGNVCHAMALRPVQLVRIDSLGAKGERCLLSNLRRAINGVLRKFR